MGKLKKSGSHESVAAAIKQFDDVIFTVTSVCSVLGDCADADNFTVTFEHLMDVKLEQKIWEEEKSMKFLQFSFRTNIEFSTALFV